MRDDLDRVLSKEQKIVPSSGFVVSVMDAVRGENVALPPIPFPWKRALPGLSVAGLALGSVCVADAIAFSRGTTTQPLPARLLSTFTLVLEGWNSVGASWIALALVVSFASVKLSMRFAFRKA